jgi:SAM-dependent methyltransferase
MALSRLEAGFLSRAFERGVLPQRCTVLEFGESAVVAGCDPADLLNIFHYQVPAVRYLLAQEQIESAKGSKANYRKNFGTARALYELIFSPCEYVAVDMDVGPRRICADLNRPLRLGRQFDCVINNGTSEHVFDQAQTFKNMHDHTKPGGTMIHWTPCIGWTDHGLYSIQPSFLFDLARANSYEMLYVELANAEVGYALSSGPSFREALIAEPSLANSQICAVLKRTDTRPFQLPIQGMYVSQAIGLAEKVVDRGSEHRTNLALGKRATQSSVSRWSWGETPEEDAAGACNGNITGYYSFHTSEEDEPWWMVDLGMIESVSEVVVYNRIDGGAPTAKAVGIMIAVSCDGVGWHTVYVGEDRRPFGGADGHPLWVSFKQPMSAKYVRLSLPGRTMLHLDEVEIY